VKNCEDMELKEQDLVQCCNFTFRICGVESWISYKRDGQYVSEQQNINARQFAKSPVSFLTRNTAESLPPRGGTGPLI